MDASEIRAGLVGRARRTIQIELFEDDYDRATELFRQRETADDEGFRVALAVGLAELRSQVDGAEPEEWVKRYNRLEGAYIGLNDRSFRLALDNERMELSRNGWIRENEALSRRVVQLTEALQRAGGQLPPAGPYLAGDPAQSPPSSDVDPLAGTDPGSDRASGRSFWNRIWGRGG